MRVDQYSPKSSTYDPELVDRELEYFTLFFPLVKLDRLLFSNYHILDNNIPDMGG